MAEESKMWYTSKILWVNIITIIILLLSMVFGDLIDVEIQAQLSIGILAIINVILRIITKTKLEW